jgi:hypothetical protein
VNIPRGNSGGAGVARESTNSHITGSIVNVTSTKRAGRRQRSGIKHQPLDQVLEASEAVRPNTRDRGIVLQQGTFIHPDNVEISRDRVQRKEKQ